MSEQVIAPYRELPRPKSVLQRWHFELPEPVRYTTVSGVEYSKGDMLTRYVLVSWGRDGDTVIFPANESGQILDMLGFKSWGTWVPAETAMNEWLAVS